VLLARTPLLMMSLASRAVGAVVVSVMGVMVVAMMVTMMVPSLLSVVPARAFLPPFPVLLLLDRHSLFRWEDLAQGRGPVQSPLILDDSEIGLFDLVFGMDEGSGSGTSGSGTSGQEPRVFMNQAYPHDRHATYIPVQGLRVGGCFIGQGVFCHDRHAIRVSVKGLGVWGLGV